MPQQERAPSSWAVSVDQNAATVSPSTGLTLDSKDDSLPFRFTFEHLRDSVFRTTFTSKTHPLPPHPSLQKPDKVVGVKAHVTASDVQQTFHVGDIRARVAWAESTPCVTIHTKDAGEQPLHEDLPHRSYVVDDKGIAHYSRFKKEALHVGLGEKAAPMDLSGRKFELSATDSFGYDVYRTDPLYKKIPILITATPKGCVGTFSTSHSRGSYSVGAEMDGMWGRYKVYRQDFGGLEEYIIVGKTLKDIVSSFASLAGYPLLVPRWAFGYLSGGMKYSMLDDPPASEALLELGRKMKEHDVPCSAYQMSSGYTVAEHPPKTRNVFTWNRHRFPNPEGFTKEYHKMGLRLIANVKPYVLANHPEYAKLKEAGALFTDPHTKQSAVTRLWSAGGGESGEGGHIDFTSKAGFDWWYEGVKQLAREGIDCIWNDNNEYTVPDDYWACKLDQSSLKIAADVKDRHEVGLWGRALHTELHGKASHDALLAVDPETRPFVLTRSATVGTLRYCCSSWSGDNVTSWDGMKGSNALSLTAGMCLLQCYGHDIGGFEGPQPTPELLLRWVQLGTYSPRFAINCFKTGDDNNVGDVIEPWMYPAITPLVRKAIKRRYAMIPYLYSLSLESHRTATPPQRWTGWGYESDPVVWTKEMLSGETQYWLGDTLLIGGVFTPGETQAKMYLPRSDGSDMGFVNLKTPYQHFEAGQWVTVDAEWHGAGIPVLAKLGTAMPVGKDVQVLSVGEKENIADLPLDDYRAVEIFPHPTDGEGKWFETTWHEDDGVSVVEKTKIAAYKVEYASTKVDIEIKFTKDDASGFVSGWKTLGVILQPGDKRPLKSSQHNVKRLSLDDQGRQHYELS